MLRIATSYQMLCLARTANKWLEKRRLIVLPLLLFIWNQLRIEALSALIPNIVSIERNRNQENVFHSFYLCYYVQ